MTINSILLDDDFNNIMSIEILLVHDLISEDLFTCSKRPTSDLIRHTEEKNIVVK